AAAMRVMCIPRSSIWVLQFANVVSKPVSMRLLAGRCVDWIGPCAEPAPPLKEKACLNSRLERSWWRRRGSNPRPPHCERGALPAELRPHRAKIIVDPQLRGKLSAAAAKSTERSRATVDCCNELALANDKPYISLTFRA